MKASTVVAEIREGVSDSALMEKYQLSSKGLESLFKKLIGAGAITQAELDSRAIPQHEEDVEIAWKCPACGKPQPQEVAVCPKCGVIVEKFVKRTLAPEVAFYSGDAAGKKPSDGFDLLRFLKTKPAWAVALGLVALLVVIGSYMMIGSSGKTSSERARKQVERMAATGAKTNEQAVSGARRKASQEAERQARRQVREEAKQQAQFQALCRPMMEEVGRVMKVLELGGFSLVEHRRMTIRFAEEIGRLQVHLTASHEHQDLMKVLQIVLKQLRGIEQAWKLLIEMESNTPNVAKEISKRGPQGFADLALERVNAVNKLDKLRYEGWALCRKNLEVALAMMKQPGKYRLEETGDSQRIMVTEVSGEESRSAAPSSP